MRTERNSGASELPASDSVPPEMLPNNSQDDDPKVDSVPPASCVSCFDASVTFPGQMYGIGGSNQKYAVYALRLRLPVESKAENDKSTESNTNIKKDRFVVIHRRFEAVRALFDALRAATSSDDNSAAAQSMNTQSVNSNDNDTLISRIRSASSVLPPYARRFLIAKESLGTRSFLLQRAAAIERFLGVLLDPLLRDSPDSDTERIDPKVDNEDDFVDNMLVASSPVLATHAWKEFLDAESLPGVSPALWETPIKAGWLTKRGHIIKNWKERWFVLVKNFLLYFPAKPDTYTVAPLGVVLLGYSEVAPLPLHSGKNFALNAFTIVNSKFNKDAKDFELLAKSEEELDQWMRAVQTAKADAVRAAEESLRPNKLALNSSTTAVPGGNTQDVSSSKEIFALKFKSGRAVRPVVEKKAADRLRAYCQSTLRVSNGKKNIVQNAEGATPDLGTSSGGPTPRHANVGQLSARFDIMSWDLSSSSQSYERLQFDPDDPSCIQYVHVIDEDQLPPHRITVQAATTFKLIEKLVDGGGGDQDMFIRSFLLTYRSFTTPAYLFDMLARCWHSEPKAQSAGCGLVGRREAVADLIDCWLHIHFYDFADDLELAMRMLSFVDTHLVKNERDGPDVIARGAELKRHLRVYCFPPSEEELQTKRASWLDAVMAPTPELPTGFGSSLIAASEDSSRFNLLVDISPLELARQCSLIDSEIFRSIKPKELLSQKWSKDDADLHAPGVVAATKRFNAVASWITSSVLFPPHAKTRAALIERIIEWLEASFNQRNYTTAGALVAGLESSAITRLKKSWAAVDRTHVKTFEQIRESLAPTKSYKAYRALLTNALEQFESSIKSDKHSTSRRLRSVLSDFAGDELPAPFGIVPFMGVSLQDLTFIEDGNPDLVDVVVVGNGSSPEPKRASASNSSMQLINFGKRIMIGDVIRQLQALQTASHYPFCPVPALQQRILDFTNTVTEKEAFALSLQHEPRQQL